MSEQQMAGLPEGPYTTDQYWMFDDYLIVRDAAGQPIVSACVDITPEENRAVMRFFADSWQIARDLRTALRFITEVHVAWRAWWDGNGHALADMGPAFDLVMAELMPEGGTE